MKHSNIAIFIPHVGCPHTCSFCNQNTISGAECLPDGNSVREICRNALKEVKSPENTEIAFFGGSFTAIPRDYMLELLTAASEFVGEDKFVGIRCSTRPDCIDGEVLELLKKYGVTAIELGAQSMDDTVLEANERGHSAEQVAEASRLIRKYGFELGLQMMTGLYESSPEKDLQTAVSIAELHPDTVRIYPVAVLNGTKLGQLYQKGVYKLVPFDEMLSLCGKMILMFENCGIKVIKCGLHASEFVENDLLAGYYHPAFRELCEMHIYRELIGCELRNADIPKDTVLTVEVSDRCISKAVGQKKANIFYFKSLGFNISIVGSNEVEPFKCKLRR